MSGKIDLKTLFVDRKDQMLSKTRLNRNIIHPVDKGDNSEKTWLQWFKECLPQRYKAAKATIFDCEGNASEQIDIVLYDAQYSYLAFHQDDILYLPAESVYAVFEVKSCFDKDNMEYAGNKAKSVRVLRRTTAPIPYAGGVYHAKKPHKIIAGILTNTSDWKDPLGKSFKKYLSSFSEYQQLDCGCILESTAFFYNCKTKILTSNSGEASLMFFFLQLLINLQSIGTVPAIDFEEYMRFLDIKEEILSDGVTKGF